MVKGDAAEDPMRVDEIKDASTTEQSSGSDDKTTTNQSADLVVEQLKESGVTFGDLQTAIKVLAAVATLTPRKPKKKHSRKRKADDTNNATEETTEPTPTTIFDDPSMIAYKHSDLRSFRKALSKCMQLHQLTMYGGQSPEEYYETKAQERTLHRQKMADTAAQRKYIAGTTLRRGRIEKMKEKQLEAKDEEMAKLQQHMMIPDGHVDSQPSNPRLLTNADTSTAADDKTESVQLPKLRSCYVCKNRFRDLHHFYDQLCPSCSALNWEKRHQTANLKGKVAIVTGSRVKIGYQTCLKLLRAGATVVATTRFPNAAAATYRQESDFAEWKDRLQVYGLDLRDVTGIEAFCRFLKVCYSKSGIDILINNACQTVRRPTAYYLPACEKEETLWKQADETHRGLLGGCVEFERVRRRLLLDHQQSSGGNNRIEAGTTPMPLLENKENKTNESPSSVVIEEVTTTTEPTTKSSTALVTTVAEEGASSTEAPFESTGMSHSAAMSQMILLPEDAGVSDDVLPPGVTDINGQQLDLRTTNSWLLKMEQVSTPEVMECMFINAIAPFVLNSRLKPLMNIPHPHEDRYIINVSAMEGKFYRYKMANHPHTNMAKAALNMMTRTSAEDLAKTHGIYMNSVDTGWINDENPLEKASRVFQESHFQTPIDEIDAAARILDPVFMGYNHPDTPKDYGKFLKDYRETEW